MGEKEAKADILRVKKEEVGSRTGQPATPTNRPPCKIVNNNIVYTSNCDEKVKIALNSILLKPINSLAFTMSHYTEEDIQNALFDIKNGLS